MKSSSQLKWIFYLSLVLLLNATVISATCLKGLYADTYGSCVKVGNKKSLFGSHPPTSPFSISHINGHLRQLRLTQPSPPLPHLQCPHKWGWNGCSASKKKPQVFVGFVNVVGSEATKLQQGIGWEYVANRVDGTFLNMAGSSLEVKRSVLEQVKSKRAILSHSITNDRPSRAYIRDAELYGIDLVGATLKQKSEGDDHNGDWKNWALSSLKRPLVWLKANAGITKVYPIVRATVAMYGELRQPAKAIAQVTSGATLELPAAKAFAKTTGFVDPTTGKIDPYFYRFAPALKKLGSKKMAVWQTPCESNRNCVKDMRKAYTFLKRKNALPDIFIILKYAKSNIKTLPEGAGRKYPNTITGTARWLMDALDKDFN